ncbi:MAG TPA: hypothetical protein VFG50_17530 [Rhodothermales bacterium]|nr:hypothetical protein [Rhodothermales bacterium]
MPHADLSERLRSVCRALLPMLLLLAGGTLVGSAHAQAPRTHAKRVQIGPGVLPGIGLQVGYVYPRSFYTTEAIVYADGSPGFAGGESNLQVSLGLGGAIRPLGLIRTIANMADTGYDLDVGLRGGPGLFFSSTETRVQKNQRFSLFLEPFIRITTRLGTQQTFFAELGFQRPLLRAGFWFGL